MTKLRGSEGRAPRARRRVTVWPLLLCACAALASFAAAGAAHAQSGRRSPTMSKTSPPPAVSEKPGEAAPASKKDVKPLAAFVILEDAGTAFEVDYTARRLVLSSFAERLDQSALVNVTRGGRATRKEARERAKAEKEAFVVLVELEEESSGVNVRAGSRPEDRTLTIRTYVYTPSTGDLKFTDHFVARPYGSRASVGGVRVPVPTRGRYPTDAQLEQAGRDAAQRLLTRFQIAIPPEVR
jgi:hypothetical protein